MMSRLAWYLGRMRAMSPREILTMRMVRMLRTSLVRNEGKIPKNLPLEIPDFPKGQRPYYAAHFSHLLEGLRQEAESILENRIRLFGREISFPDEPDWNRDFVTGRSWPLKRADYRTCPAGDPKDVWELNRQQFLPVLGKAFYLTGDERYARKALNMIDSWIEQNPPHSGINWSSGIELSLRMLSWLWTLRFLADDGNRSSGTDHRIRESLFRQTRHIIKNLSLYSSANNHLIAELAAAACLGTYLRRRKWERKALFLLEKEIDHQILPDGVGAEQSPFYQAHVMEFYGLVGLLLKEKGIAVPPGISAGLRRGAEFLQSLIDESGMPPQIGDNDSGEMLRLSSSYGPFKSLLNLVAYVCEDFGVLQADAARDEKTFWLIGAENFRVLIEKTGERKDAFRRAFPSGGYYILEKTIAGVRIKIIFDCGPLGLKPLAGHGHADALSFILSIGQTPVFIDPGTYTYQKSDFWRNYFRGTSAHNTIRLDEEDQSRFGGTFLALSRAESQCLEWEEGSTISGLHDGYSRKKTPAVHRRTISFEDRRPVVRIVDTVTSSGPHLLEQYFHVDRRLPVRDIGGNRFEIKTPAKTVILSLDPCLEVRVHHGNESFPLGWQSESFGNKEKTHTIAGQKRITGKTTILSEILLESVPA